MAAASGSMVPAKLVLKGSTGTTLHERFSKLSKLRPPPESQQVTVNLGQNQAQASSKRNSRLAQQMASRGLDLPQPQQHQQHQQRQHNQQMLQRQQPQRHQQMQQRQQPQQQQQQRVGLYLGQEQQNRLSQQMQSYWAHQQPPFQQSFQPVFQQTTAKSRLGVPRGWGSAPARLRNLQPVRPSVHTRLSLSLGKGQYNGYNLRSGQRGRGRGRYNWGGRGGTSRGGYTAQALMAITSRVNRGRGQGRGKGRGQVRSGVSNGGQSFRGRGARGANRGGRGRGQYRPTANKDTLDNELDVYMSQAQA